VKNVLRERSGARESRCDARALFACCAAGCEKIPARALKNRFRKEKNRI